MVDLGSEADDRRFERVVFGEVDEDCEAAALKYMSGLGMVSRFASGTHGI